MAALIVNMGRLNRNIGPRRLVTVIRRIRPGRLGLQPGQVRSTPWFQLAVKRPARLWRACQHPRRGHGRLAARLCRDRASYAADVGLWLEH